MFFLFFSLQHYFVNYLKVFIHLYVFQTFVHIMWRQSDLYHIPQEYLRICLYRRVISFTIIQFLPIFCSVHPKCHSYGNILFAVLGTVNEQSISRATIKLQPVHTRCIMQRIMLQIQSSFGYFYRRQPRQRRATGYFYAMLHAHVERISTINSTLTQLCAPTQSALPSRTPISVRACFCCCRVIRSSTFYLFLRCVDLPCFTP